MDVSKLLNGWSYDNRWNGGDAMTLFRQLDVIHVQCSDCNIIFTVISEQIGTTTNCPSCGAEGVIE